MSSAGDTLKTLLASKPSSFEVTHISDGVAHGIAEIETNLSLEPKRFALCIECTDRGVKVRESEPGALLPKACPERHIESDSNLCLGLRAGHGITTPRECEDWWSHLYQFLVLQTSVARTGCWPTKYALAHGEGGDAQLKAAQTAKRLGLLDDYDDYLRGTQSYIADLVDDYKKRRADALKKNRPVAHIDDMLVDQATALAKERGSKKLTDRKRARLVRTLARFDLRRTEKEREYWDYCRKAGMTCCGTMRSCPLKQPDA